MADYAQFLERKSQLGTRSGFEPVWMPDFLFDFQKALVEWAVLKGKAAILAGTGLGKTIQQLTWAENIVRKENARVLIVSPLAVTTQTVQEGEKFGIDCYRSRDGKLKDGAGIVVTNYERLHYFNPDDFAGVVCDESAAIKSFEGERQKVVTDFMRTVPYRLLCSAAPAPNDFIELGTSAEALGELGRMDMLSMFFKNDENSLHPIWWGARWRFKQHAEQMFWRWVCSWARVCQKPSDLGFDDGPFILPPLHIHETVVENSEPLEGYLFRMPAVTLKDQRAERRQTLKARCEAVAGKVSKHDCSMVFCHLNPEGDLLEDMIPNALQIKGSDSDEWKEAVVEWFTGRKCICGDRMFSPKLATWQKGHLDTGASTIKSIALKDSRNPSDTATSTKKKKSNISGSTIETIQTNSSETKVSERSAIGKGESATAKTQNGGNPKSIKLKSTGSNTRILESKDSLNATEFPSTSTKNFQYEDAPSADERLNDSELTTAIKTESLGASSATLATLDSESSEMIQDVLKRQRCICGHASGIRRLISKPVMLGYGLNFQHCHHMTFFPSHSWEQYFQGVRRCWRFGQQHPVTVDIITSEGELGVMKNLQRKAEAADRMFAALVTEMNDAMGIQRVNNRTKEVMQPSWE